MPTTGCSTLSAFRGAKKSRLRKPQEPAARRSKRCGNTPPSALEERSGRFYVTPSDRLPRRMRMLTPQGEVIVRTTSSRKATQIADYNNALREYVLTRDTDRNQKVRKQDRAQRWRAVHLRHRYAHARSLRASRRRAFRGYLRARCAGMSDTKKLLRFGTDDPRCAKCGNDDRRALCRARRAENR